MRTWNRIRHLFKRRKFERDLQEELRIHREMAEENERRLGASEDEARHNASRSIGSTMLALEDSRSAWSFVWLDSMVRDTRYGSRMLCKSPIVTATAILSLALAIGACTAAYSLIDALILRPLPVRDPEGLVYLTYPSDLPGAPEDDSFTYPLFERLRDASREKVELFGVSWPRPRDVTLGNSTEEIRAQFVSGDALAILGVKPALGRLLNAEDDRYPGESPVAVISYEFWMRMGGRPDILNQPLDLMDSSSAAAA